MKSYRITAAILCAFGVILGAFGAHKLKEILEPTQLESFHTAIRYLFLHSIVLLVLNLVQRPIAYLKRINNLFLLGITLFSGSIFLLISGFKNAFVGITTPIGGSVLIVAWLLLAYSFSKES